jgi:hypothetical protein
MILLQYLARNRKHGTHILLIKLHVCCYRLHREGLWSEASSVWYYFMWEWCPLSNGRWSDSVLLCARLPWRSVPVSIRRVSTRTKVQEWEINLHLWHKYYWKISLTYYGALHTNYHLTCAGVWMVEHAWTVWTTSRVPVHRNWQVNSVNVSSLVLDNLTVLILCHH